MATDMTKLATDLSNNCFQLTVQLRKKLAFEWIFARRFLSKNLVAFEYREQRVLFVLLFLQRRWKFISLFNQ